MRTIQEEFWAGDFGADYVSRNRGERLLAAKTAMFSTILRSAKGVGSVRELGANIGLNLKAIRSLLPNVQLQAVEINPQAFAELSRIPGIRATNGSLYDALPGEPADLSFTSGVLIHLEPDTLPVAYDRLYESSKRYVLVSEYYNPAPVEVTYRGHSNRLFKRDFAGELMDRHPDLHLIDYGFIYRRDPTFPADDATWFLMEKRGLA